MAIDYVHHPETGKYHIPSPSEGKTMCGRDLSLFDNVANPAGITRSIVCVTCSSRAAANKRARMAVKRG